MFCVKSKSGFLIWVLLSDHIVHAWEDIVHIHSLESRIFYTYKLLITFYDSSINLTEIIPSAIDQCKIEGTLALLPSDKAPRLDGIPNYLLRHCRITLCKVLAD
ncbi:hypothetical protein HI914_04350 [Erysiphe necator]|nr:hypothetical protein HI914_04350 [Erysiphe necator]